MVKRNLCVPSWADFMSGKEGTEGFYIIRKENNKNIYFGPFKTSLISEFFNYLAFNNPYDLDGINNSKQNILLYDGIDDSIKRIFIHPRYLCFEGSRFGIWWQSMYGHKLTQRIVLKVARECKAEGYEAFRKWLLLGSKIDNESIYGQFI